MTWFKKALAYRITEMTELTPGTLQSALASKLARMPGNDELSTYGFVTPLPQVDGVKSEVLAHPCGGGILVCAEKWLRRVPSKAVEKDLSAQVSKIEEAQGRKVKGRERAEMKEAIVSAMLPSLVPDCKHTTALILPSQGLILVDTATPSVAEDLLSTLREVIGSLPVRPLRTINSPADTMTGWLRAGTPPEGFVLLDSAALVSQVDGNTSKVRLSKVDLTSEEVQLHIAAGRKAAQLALGWTDKVLFKLTDKLAIESIKLSDVLTTEVLHANGEGDVLQHFDGSMTIMVDTLGRLFQAVLAALGGEEIPQSLKEAA